MCGAEGNRDISTSTVWEVLKNWSVKQGLMYSAKVNMVCIDYPMLVEIYCGMHLRIIADGSFSQQTLIESLIWRIMRIVVMSVSISF